MHAAGNDLGTLSSTFHHFHIHTIFVAGAGRWGSGRGGVEYTRLNYEYLCNRRHVVHFGQLSSPRLASPSSFIHVPFVVRVSMANVIVVAALLGAGLSVSENLNCPNIRYEFSLLHWPHFHVPSNGRGWPGSDVGGASCARVLCSVQFHLNLLKFHILF